MSATFEQSIVIRGDRAALFRLSQDYDRRLSWDPFLREARLVDGAVAIAPGVRAWCVARSGLGMETEYVSVKAPDTVAVRMTRGPFFIASFAGSWRFRDVGGGRTEIAFRYHVEGRPRALGPVLRAVFARDTKRRLEALKRAVETTRILEEIQA
jgi:ribosome-associated toxin RatA of RatAB toxin-antitoxin module